MIIEKENNSKKKRRDEEKQKAIAMYFKQMNPSSTSEPDENQINPPAVTENVQPSEKTNPKIFQFPTTQSAAKWDDDLPF